MRAALRAPATVDKRLTRDGEHFFIVPAFWRALEWLLERGEVSMSLIVFVYREKKILTTVLEKKKAFSSCDSNFW